MRTKQIYYTKDKNKVLTTKCPYGVKSVFNNLSPACVAPITCRRYCRFFGGYNKNFIHAICCKHPGKQINK